MSVTALAEKLPAAARRGEYRGAETAAVYSDSRKEFAALLSDCAIYDLGWRAKISLSGKDRVRWLNGMITNNVRDLVTGHGLYAFLLNPQGRILGDMYAYNRGETLLLDTDQSQADKLAELLKRYIIMDKVELANVSDHLTAIGVSGPQSRELLRRAGFDLPELAPLQLADTIWQGILLTLVHGVSAGPGADHRESYEIWVAPENANSVWQALMEAHARPVGSEALELYRIASGIPSYGQDIRERDLPQETEQTRALHFAKGCYIGQEIVERIRSRGNVHRKFTGFVIDGPPPPPGTKLQLEGKDIGEITSVASLPTTNGERVVALGYIRREAAAPGNVLQAGEGRATVAELPFQNIFD
jgi:folate-binding protein YgfZ